MRWLAGWSGSAAKLLIPARPPAAFRAATAGPTGAGPTGAGPTTATAQDALAALAAVRPLAATALWTGPDPLWAVGDWRPEEIRQAVQLPGTGHPAVSTGPRPADLSQDTESVSRLLVLGHCGATDQELAAGLAAARGGAVRQLTGWPGSYAVVLRIGTRSTLLLTDLAGLQPVFHTPWCGGTAYATAALPLADLIGAPVDTGHLAAALACPESPEALGTGTPYVGVRRVPPGHTLAIRGGRPHLTEYDDEGAPGGVRSRHGGEAPAVRELTRTLLEAVRSRVRSAPGAAAGLGPRRPRIGADLSYGTASTALALLAAAVPIGPGSGAGLGAGAGVGSAVDPAPGPAAEAVARADGAPRTGATKGSWTRQDPAPRSPEPELLTAVTVRESPRSTPEAPGEVGRSRLRHTVLAATPAGLPYADLTAGPLTDEPGRALITAPGTAARLSAGGVDHLTGHGARQVLDGHPARLADLLREGRPRELLPPVAALAGLDRALAGTLTGAVRTPVTVLRAARRLARGGYAEALDDAAVLLTARRGAVRRGTRPGTRYTAGAYSVADLAWCVPGPAARFLSDDALASVALRLRLAARGPAPELHPGVRRARLALHHHAGAYRTLVHAAEQHGQRVHAPFFDNRVIRAARLLPADLRLQPGARHALLRAVLAGAGRVDLPADWGRAPRPDRAEAARAGLRAAADALAELFQEPLLAEAGLIDLPAVRRALRRAADPYADLPPGALDGLADVVAVELWLRRFEARRHGSCWTGLPLPQRRAVAEARFA
ncbi:asparagine synthase-related protein [Kitasatospora sp. NBC_01287]|uniref:asparagine synthase-related protein n=1 Tax=Kitasatospora sp. NBC_01287 TaxID=2903573 RepID=UPI00225A1E48|nr:asparagine synthase-related protein [Kitasatospora sp. NBC_01287]MCX4747443.1 asparagine synthase-related protein [Kitasatospora sp. NBC_01287]